MTNTNCLEGLRCPKCGQNDRLLISGFAEFEVTDYGGEAVGAQEWDDESATRCPECGHSGVLREFREPEAPSAPASVAIKLTTPDEIRAACDMAVLMGEKQFQVMYKPDQAEDDDYVGVNLDEFSEARSDDYFLVDFLAGRHSWELWVYDKQEAGQLNGTVAGKEVA